MKSALLNITENTKQARRIEVIEMKYGSRFRRHLNVWVTSRRAIEKPILCTFRGRL